MGAPEHLRSATDRALASVLRVGRVSSVNHARHTARVRFAEDGDSAESGDLAMLVTRPGDKSLPAIDAPVLCAIEPGSAGVGYVLGCLYTDADAPPTEDDARVLEGDNLRLGGAAAEDPVALAPATKNEIQKVLDYAQGISDAIQAGVAVPQDGGAALQASIVLQLQANVLPTLSEPGAEKVTAI